MKDQLQSISIAGRNVPKYVKLPYRRSVGLMVLNREKKVFVGKRIDTKNDTWQMPQGGIKEDETIVEAGLRELFEETNMKDVKIIAETINWVYYDLPEFLVEKMWDGKYRGQKQKWLLLYFSGENSGIDISKSAAEFESWKWTDLDNVSEIVIAFKRQLYLSIIKEFRVIIQNLKIK